MRKSSVEKFKSILLFPLQLKKQLRKYLTTVIIKGDEQDSATVPQNYEYLSFQNASRPRSGTGLF